MPSASPDSAIRFLNAYRALIRTAANEEELRSHFDHAARTILNIQDLKLEHGRQDVRRNRVIIEFKDKGLFQGRDASAKKQEAVDQLVGIYIPRQAKQDGRNVADYIGVCFDGEHLAFAYLEDADHYRVTDLRPFDEHSAAALVQVLEQDSRIELTPDNVATDFGPDASIAHTVIRALWDHLEAALEQDVPKVVMLFTEWNDLFEQTTSLGHIGRTRLQDYLREIGLPPRADLTKVLFVLHAYHALFFKLLAAEVVLANRYLQNTPQDYCFRAASLDDAGLLESLESDIENSGIFQQVHVQNFVEGSFFSWYLTGAPASLAAAIRQMLHRLSLYHLSGLQLARTRDIVKHIYQKLVPAPLRHNIGEYFTPEWLVEFTLDQVGYAGPEILVRRYLDPCAGSGNFLIHAIARYKVEASRAGWSPEQTLKGITDNVIGFDLNPLAVLTARVNYLMAISDLIDGSADVDIPVYQADAVYAPAAAVPGAKTRSYEIPTRRRPILVELPESLIQNRSLFAWVMETMHDVIRRGDPEEVFLAELEHDLVYREDTDSAGWRSYLRSMYVEIAELERQGWDGIWCRIVRNHYASAAVGACQYIASNPPWVRWSELPPRYTERIKPTCIAYGIFSEDRFFGGNELDISAMILYTAADKWLDRAGGRLSFVIPQNHFQSQSSGGFRRFVVKGTPLSVERVDDFGPVRPWPELGNRPAVLTATFGKPTRYPVRYYLWERLASVTIPQDESLATALVKLKAEELEANALDVPGQRWSLLPPGQFAVLRSLQGEDPRIKGRKGVVTDLNGAYFVQLMGSVRRSTAIRFQNAPGEGRKPVPQLNGEAEVDLIYPLIKGAENIKAFYATTSPFHVLIPNQTINPRGIPTVSRFAETGHVRALEYFRSVDRHGHLLAQRSTWKTRMAGYYDEKVRRRDMRRADVPFFAIYNVGPYTFAPYKVVWAEMAGTLQAAVISDAEVPFGGGRKTIVPDHKVYFAAFNSEDEAHYYCALLNSAPVRAFVDSFTIKIQVGTLFRHMQLPPFMPGAPLAESLVRASRAAHVELAATNGDADVTRFRVQIDRLAGELLAQHAERPRPESGQLPLQV